MEETMLTWNITNWITVILMVVVGFALLHFTAQAVRSVSGSKKAAE